MITICMNDRQHVITDEQLSVCQEIRVCRLLDIQSYLFFIFFITQKLLLYFSSAQINHLYDV